MKDVVTLLLENRPSSPIAFMAKYFRTVTQGSSPLLRAYRYIRLASPSQDAFIDNLVAAYVALDAKRGASGVTGAELLRLLRLLCADCPVDVTRALLLSVDRTESDPVSFEEFSAVIRSGLLYDDFFQRASSLFASCDPNRTGVVPRSMLELAVRQVSGGGAAASVPADASTAASLAARAEQHRLQREVQCEVALRLDGGNSGTGGSGSGGGGGGGGGTAAAPGSSATVTLEEFLNALFAASAGGQFASLGSRASEPTSQPAPNARGAAAAGAGGVATSSAATAYMRGAPLAIGKTTRYSQGAAADGPDITV